MEDPKLTKKIVRREVTRVLSPGTALDAGLGQEQNNFLAALYEATPRRALVQEKRFVRWRCWMSRRASFAPRSFVARMPVRKPSMRCCWPLPARC